jgi:hypothetical protein
VAGRPELQLWPYMAAASQISTWKDSSKVPLYKEAAVGLIPGAILL